jgi:hypothetical protein
MAGSLNRSRPEDQALLSGALSLSLLLALLPVAGGVAGCLALSGFAFGLPQSNSLAPVPVSALSFSLGSDVNGGESPGRRYQLLRWTFSPMWRSILIPLVLTVAVCIVFFDTTFRRYFRDICQLLDLPPPCPVPAA